MDHLLRRFGVFLLGLALLFVAFLMFKRRDDWYDWVEGYRDRHPILRSLNPLAGLNTPTLSKWNAIWCGIVAALMGALLIFGALIGKFGQ